MKYKYATTRRNTPVYANAKVSKKRRCKKLLNSKCFIAGLITVVGSMLMGAQVDAATYASGSATVANDPDTSVVLQDGAAITLDGAGSVLTFPGGPSLELQGDSSLTLFDADETIRSLNSAPGGVQDAEIILNANTLNIALSAASTYEGDVSASIGGSLLITSAGGAQTINFLGNQDSLVLNGAAIDGGLGAPTFRIGTGVTANVAADAISTGAGVEVAGTLNLAGVETLTDLNILGGGVVTTGGNLNVNDCLNVDGTLNMGGALGVVGLKGGGVINMNNFDFCIAPAAPTVLGLTFTGTGDFIKFGDAPLTLTANQTYTGTTWVGNGDLILNGTSQSDTIFVTNDRTGPAMLDVTAAGGTTPAGVLAKPGTALPRLFANAALVAGNITIGSAANGEGAQMFTGPAGSILASTADVTVFAGSGVFAGLQTQGNETFRSFTGDNTGAGNGNNAFLQLGGDLTLDTLNGSGTVSIGSPPPLGGVPALPAGSHTLTVGNNNGASTFAGRIVGDGTVVKTGTGEVIFSDTVGASTYTGQTRVEGGVLHIQADTALGATGAANNTVVANTNSQLLLSGGITVGEQIHATGDGADGTGAIRSNGGNNTLNGDLFVEGTTSIENSVTGTTLTINGDINEDNTEIPNVNIEGLRLGGAGDIDVDGRIENKSDGDVIETLTKFGSGQVDLRSADHDHTEHNTILEGVLLVDNQFQLGDGAFGAPSGESYEVRFEDNNNQTSELRIDTSGGAKSFASTFFAFNGGPNAALNNGGVVGTIGVTDAGNDVTTDFDDYGSDNDQNVLRKAGAGTLVIDLDDPRDLTPVPAPGPLSVCATALFAPNSTDFAPGSGLIVDPAAGTVVFDNSGNGLATLTLNGIGNINGDPSLSTGTLQLDNLNLIVDQTTPTFFGGQIVTNGAIGVDGVGLTISGPQPGITGQIVVINGGILTIGDYGSLGSNGNYTANGTYVCGDGTLALNALTGTAPLNERITLFNNANLVNNAGTNTIASEIFLHHDPLDNPNPGGHHTANIGAAADSQLNLTGGIDAHDTPGDMNLHINPAAAHLGTVNVDSEIEATVVDLDINNSAGGNTILGANNSYTGETRIHGGTVDVGGNNGAFSAGQVTIAGSATIGGSGAVLPNDIQIDAGQILTTTDSLGSTGVISGDGALTVGGAATLTLQGDNTYTGATKVDAAGTLNVVGTLASQSISVAANGELNTQGTERLDNAATVDIAADGTWNLGGDETIGTLNGAGTVDIGTSSLTVGTGAFSGTIQNHHGALNKVGAGTLTFNAADLNFVGGIHAQAGTLAFTNGTTVVATQLEIDNFATVNITNSSFGGDGASVSTIDINQGGTLNLDGATIAANSTVNVDGTLNVINDSTAWNITGASTGLINLNANTLSLHGIDFDGTITGTGGVNVVSGNLNLDGNSTYTGNTMITGAGTEVFLNGSIDSGTVTVGAGASLVLGNNHGAHIVDTATVVVGGTLNVSPAGERVAQLDVNGGNIDGTGTLTAGIYNLNNGATVNANLGLGTLNSAGPAANTLHGDSAASTVNVDSGTLNLNGELTSGILNLTIDAGATLATGGAERINDNATATVNGNLSLGGDETFRTLNGAGTGVVANNGNMLTVSGGAYAGNITGAGALNKNGAGTLTLSSAVDYSGATNVNAGTLSVAGINNSLAVNVANGATLTTTGNEQLANNGTLNANGTVNLGGNESVNILNGGITGLVNNGGNNLTVNSGSFGGSITGAGDLNKESNGTLALTGDSSMTGELDINAGTVELSGTIASGSVDVANNAVLNLNGDERLANNANVNVAGTLNLGGAETVANLDVTSGSVGGTGTLTAATYDLNNATTGSTAHLGAGTLNSDGTTTLNGNSGADTVNVDSGTLNVEGQLTNSSVSVVVDAGTNLNTNGNERINNGGSVNANGTWNLGGHETITTLNGSGTVDLNTFSLTVDNGLFTGTMQNHHGDLNKTGGGTMVFDNANGTFTGAVHVEGGTLTLQNGTTFAATEYEIDGFATMNVNGSTLGNVGNPVNINVNVDGTLNLDNATIAGSIANPSNLNIDGTLNVNGNSSVWDVTGGNTGVINLNNASVLSLNGIDFDGMINGNGSITATSGTVDLGGNSNFTGDLTVNNGSTVELEGTVTGAANVVVNSGGTLKLQSPERINDTANLNVAGTLQLNGQETVADVVLSGLLTGNGILELDNVATGDFSLNNGAMTDAGADLGDGDLITNGAVAIHGNKTGGNDAVGDTTTVQSGVTDLHGTITDPDGLGIQVNAGGTLQLHHDERIGDNAIVTVNGRLNLWGTENVTTFNMNGPGSVLGLTPGAPNPSLLTADTYNLGNGATTETGANLGEGILNTVDIAPNAPVTLNGESAADTVNIVPNTHLILGAAERLDDTATVNNNGRLSIFGVETIGIYNSTGQLSRSPGAPNPSTLIAGTYNLEAGTVVDSDVNLGGGVVNVGCNIPGVITLNGNSAAEDVTVCTGTTFNLNGQLTNIGTDQGNPGDNLTIQSGATLNLGSAERINNNAVVLNDGTLNLNGTETIGTFTSSGTLGGAGTLIGTGNTINLINGHTSLIPTAIVDYSGTSAANPSLTSNGTVTINGTANDTALANNATLEFDFGVIQSGTLNLNGLIVDNSVAQDPNLTIRNTATLDSGSGNRIADTATINIDTGGTWDLNGSERVSVINSGGALTGTSHLDATNGFFFTNGATVASGVVLDQGTVNSTGIVQIDSNHTHTTLLNVDGGVLTITGTWGDLVTGNIDPGATLMLGGPNLLNDGATINNWGELDLNGNETILTYNSNGGFLDDSGLLTATTYTLSNGASTDFGANLGTGTLNVINVSPPIGDDPAVVLNGNTNADFININSGTTLATNGAVQNAAGIITISSNGTWDVNNSSYDYMRLQGNGTVDSYSLAGFDFTNRDTVAPGQVDGQVGTLRIAGDYIERGTLEIEFQPGASDFSNHDRLIVDRFVSLQTGSTLDLESINGFNANNIQCGERFNVIGIGGGITISGGWDSIAGSTTLGTQTWGNQVLFDRGTGDVVGTGLAFGQDNSDIPGIDANQLAIFNAITDAAIDTVGNYNSDDFGAGTVLNNILNAADPGNGGSTETKLAAINTLMPESYGGAVDYAMHATRAYTETATRVTPFGASSYTPPVVTDAKGGGVVADEKDAAPAPVSSGHNYQVFGGYHSMDLESDSSHNGHDYDLESRGGFAGVRAKAGDKFTYGAFLGIDSGSVRSSGLDLDADGTVLGVFAHYQANEKTTVWANLSYGSFEFDGHRTALGGTLSVDNFDADALQVGVGVDYLAYDNNRGFTITPGLGLRYIDASTDSITESGGPAALVIDGIDAESLLLDLTVKFAYNPEGQRYGFHGHLGYTHDFEDADRDIDAMLASGSPYFRVVAPGLGDSAFTYGVGGYYNITDDLRVDLNYRGESRSDSDDSHAIDLRFTYGF